MRPPPRHVFSGHWLPAGRARYLRSRHSIGREPDEDHTNARARGARRRSARPRGRRRPGGGKGLAGGSRGRRGPACLPPPQRRLAAARHRPGRMPFSRAGRVLERRRSCRRARAGGPARTEGRSGRRADHAGRPRGNRLHDRRWRGREGRTRLRRRGHGALPLRRWRISAPTTPASTRRPRRRRPRSS